LEWEDTSHAKDTKLDWNGAERYCQNLELDGESDWRLPTSKELWYLGDRSKSDPALNGEFRNSGTTSYWSSQKVNYSGYGENNWGTRFSDGADIWEKRTENHLTRCVRGVSHYEDIQFQRDSSRAVVKDMTNGLEWQDGGETVRRNWSGAKEYCRDLNFGGKSDWRLPTVEELYSITDQRKSSSPFVSREFQNMESNWFWSKTDCNKYSSASLVVDFSYGSGSWTHRSDYRSVVCVRDL
jgi:hypothetical protein